MASFNYRTCLEDRYKNPVIVNMLPFIKRLEQIGLHVCSIKLFADVHCHLLLLLLLLLFLLLTWIIVWLLSICGHSIINWTRNWGLNPTFAMLGMKRNHPVQGSSVRTTKSLPWDFVDPNRLRFGPSPDPTELTQLGSLELLSLKLLIGCEIFDTNGYEVLLYNHCN